MSALAARRAASAGSAAMNPQNGDIIPQTAPAVARPEPQPNGRARIPSPIPYLRMVEDEDSPAASPKSRSAKRQRRNIKSKKETRYYAPQLRVAAEVAPAQGKGKGKGKARAFSPSQPVGAEFEYDSSGESSASQDVNEGIKLNGDEYDSAASAASSVAGPSRSRLPLPAEIPNQAGVARSTFTPREGINVCAVSEDIVRTQGLEGPSRVVVVSLQEGESLVLAGMYNLLPLSGSLQLCGTTLSPSTSGSTRRAYRIFAPTSHPLPVITPSKASSSPGHSSSKLRSDWKLPSNFILPDTFSSTSVFMLSELHCGLEGMASGAVSGFTGIWPSSNPFVDLRGVSLIPHESNLSAYPYQTPSSWLEALSTLHPARSSPPDDFAETEKCPIVLVRGPKRCGKSTFARAALNRLLETHDKVVWLECDLGQSEFSCGGLTGLWEVSSAFLGPSFTHFQVPLRAHFLGAFTPTICPDEYLLSIHQLLEFYRYRLPSNLPLVINTQGWIKGLGEDLLREIELAAEPTHIFTFEPGPAPAELPPNNRWTHSPIMPLFALPRTGQDLPIQKTLEAARISPLQVRYTASDFRTLATMSYFHSSLPTSHQDSWSFEEPLSAFEPWEVEIGTDSAIKAVYLMGEGSDGITTEDLSLALSGSIVGLLNLAELPTTIYEQGRSLPDVENYSCLGMGIIRGIRSTKMGYRLHLLTPVAAQALGEVNGVVQNGAMELPLCGLLDWRDPSATSLVARRLEEIPFVDASGADGIGVEKRKFRRNIMRKGM